MQEAWQEVFSSDGFMPHIHCYLSKPALVWTMFVTDLLIGIAYVGISITLWGLIQKIKIPFSFVVLCFGVFIGACGATHFMEVYTLWHPVYWAAAGIKILTAIASVGTGAYLYRLRGPLIQVAEAAKLSEQRRLDLEVLTDTLEHRVRERTKALNQALKIRDDFLSVASHEFRTPLTALRLKTEIHRRLLANENGDLAQKFSKFTDEIEGQIGRLSKLVEDLLDLSQVRSGSLGLSPVEFDLSQLLEQSIEKLGTSLQLAQIKLDVQITQGVHFFGDAFRFEQVFTNLISNSARYAPNTELLISLRRSTPSEIEIVFHDQGPGITAQNAEKIFNQFEQLQPANHVQGMGIGLFISRSIVQAHHGSIELVPAAKGAKFVMKLPLPNNPIALDSSA